MSLILAKRALCNDPADYESLLPSITILKNLLECNPSGKTESGVATQLIRKLFNDSVWTNVGTEDAFHSCFYETTVYYNKKSCAEQTGMGSVVWNPEVDTRLQNEIAAIFADLGGVEDSAAPVYANYTGPHNKVSDYNTFKKIADLLAAFLVKVSATPGNYDLEQVIEVLDSMCELVEQKISINRVLRKTQLTIDHCDF